MSNEPMVFKHEYAGFWYVITITGTKGSIRPEEGQHRAANKERHMRAAMEEWQTQMEKAYGVR